MLQSTINFFQQISKQLLLDLKPLFNVKESLGTYLLGEKKVNFKFKNRLGFTGRPLAFLERYCLIFPYHYHSRLKIILKELLRTIKIHNFFMNKNHFIFYVRTKWRLIMIYFYLYEQLKDLWKYFFNLNNYFCLYS